MRSPFPILAATVLLGACTYGSHEAGRGAALPVGDDAGAPPLDDASAAAPAPQPTAPQPTEPQPTEPQPTEPQPTEPQPEPPAPADPPATSTAFHDDHAVAVTIEAWRWRASTVGDVPSPDTERCADLFAGLEIIAPDSDQFRALCHRCDTRDDAPRCELLGRANACAPWGDPSVENGHGPDSRALVVLDATLAENAATRDRLVVHETIHHLGWCTLVGADSAHRNDDWWCGDDPDCIAARAQDDLSP